MPRRVLADFRASGMTQEIKTLSDRPHYYKRVVPPSLMTRVRAHAASENGRRALDTAEFGRSRSPTVPRAALWGLQAAGDSSTTWLGARETGLPEGFAIS